VYVLCGRTLITFYVVGVVDNKQEVHRGVDVVSTLVKKLHSSTDAFDFRVVELDTVGEIWFYIFLFHLF